MYILRKIHEKKRQLFPKFLDTRKRISYNIFSICVSKCLPFETHFFMPKTASVFYLTNIPNMCKIKLSFNVKTLV